MYWFHTHFPFLGLGTRWPGQTVGGTLVTLVSGKCQGNRVRASFFVQFHFGWYHATIPHDRVFILLLPHCHTQLDGKSNSMWGKNQPHIAAYCRWGITRLRRMWHRGAISRTPILGNSWICRDSFDCLRRLLVLTTTSSRCGGEEGKKLGENWEFEAAMVNLARLSSTTGLVADHVRLPALDNYNICFCFFLGRHP